MARRDAPDYGLDPAAITETREWVALTALFARMHVDLMEDLLLAVEKNDMHQAATTRGKIYMLREIVDIPKYVALVQQQMENQNGRGN